MYQINSNGYQPDTPEELREKIIQDNVENNPAFQDLPQTLQGNLIDQGAMFLMYQELNIQRLFNFPAMSQANDLLFFLMGDDRNIRRKGAYQSEVTLRFTATAGTIIPQDFRVQDPTSGITFRTYEESLITSTTGIIDVLAYTKETNIPTIGIGAITKIVDNTPNIQVTNIDSPTQPQDIESIESYKNRVRMRYRNPKFGSFGSLLGEIEAVEGVDTRLVGFRQSEITESGSKWNAFEVVVGGGNPINIAYAIYLAGGINGFRYLSNPSGGESQRTVTQNLRVRNQTIPIKFTRPKKLDLEIKVSVKFQNVEASSASIEALTQAKMDDYINNVPIGVPLNTISLANAFLEGLSKAGGTALNIAQNQITFTLKKNTQAFNPNGDGYYILEFDEYVVLSKYEVEINQ